MTGGWKPWTQKQELYVLNVLVSGYPFQEDKRIRNNRDFSITDVKNNGISFSNEELRDLNSDYVAAKSDYKTMQETLVSDIVDVASGYSDPLNQLADAISHLDTLVGLAVSAVDGNFVRPKVSSEKENE